MTKAINLKSDFIAFDCEDGVAINKKVSDLPPNCKKFKYKNKNSYIRKMPEKQFEIFLKKIIIIQNFQIGVYV